MNQKSRNRIYKHWWIARSGFFIFENAISVTVNVCIVLIFFCYNLWWLLNILFILNLCLLFLCRKNKIEKSKRFLFVSATEHFWCWCLLLIIFIVIFLGSQNHFEAKIIVSLIYPFKLILCQLNVFYFVKITNLQ